MSIDITTLLRTTNSAIPLTDQPTKLPAPQHFATVAALVTAAGIERQNIGAAAPVVPIWAHGTPITVGSDSPFVVRNWFIGANSAASHARNVAFPDGTQATLAAESNAVLPAPTGGASGDMAWSMLTRSAWINTSGLWTNTNLVDVTASRNLTDADLDRVLVCNSSTDIVLTLPSTVGFAERTLTVRRIGTGVVSVVAGTSATVTDPYSLPPAPVDGEMALRFKSPGVAVRVA